MERKNQLSLFSASREKGSAEWATFDGIREDRVGIFRVKQPDHTPRYSERILKRPVRPQSLFFRPKGAQ